MAEDELLKEDGFAIELENGIGEILLESDTGLGDTGESLNLFLLGYQ